LVERVRATGVDACLVVQGSADVLTPAAVTATYRLIQEALTNSVKHAGPHAAVAVSIAHTPSATVVVVDDDGGDAEHRPAVPGTGTGLRGVQERVRAAGGTFEAGPTESGFRVCAEFPAQHRRSRR
jgi:signal transduction histidine kinase